MKRHQMEIKLICDGYNYVMCDVELNENVNERTIIITESGMKAILKELATLQGYYQTNYRELHFRGIDERAGRDVRIARDPAIDYYMGRAWGEPRFDPRADLEQLNREVLRRGTNNEGE